MKKFFLFVAVLLIPISLLADERQQLTRDEVSVIKKKLAAVLEAVGQPPAGYVKEDEHFTLPTEVYPVKGSGKFRPVYASADRRFGGGSAQKAKKADKIGEEYEKKMSQALAKGDYQEVQRLSMEMQQAAGKAHVEEVESRKEPVSVRVSLNSGQYQSIDPDMVLFEKPGVIALKFLDSGDEEKGRIVVYFDPVSLKNTKQLSLIELKEPQDGVGKRGHILYLTVELSGPTGAVEGMAKKINIGSILAQIDAR